MSTNNQNMDNFQDSPQFQEAVKNAVNKALLDFFEKLEVKEEKSEGCPYLTPVPPCWQTCTDNELRDRNKEKCIPPFWFMRHYFENQLPPCCWQEEQCQRPWNPPSRYFDGPGRVNEYSRWQQEPRGWAPWWAHRNADTTEQPPREWTPWWATRNADATARGVDNNRPQQPPREWRPWWENKNNDTCEQTPKDWVPWWANRNTDTSGRSGDNNKPQQPHREWIPWWFARNSDNHGKSGDNNNSSSFWR
ncbi:bifunctional endo-1,4-beta-xylanase XylA-like [Diorhabda sublineata]|uniref:bifunctional endo-1,4-beta-xylanase XylA-like n=1 Tax=Diorhabda sublineata TaxID=1163346 RepID=UPI0024E139CF|nr:bifunctional endo-1,4-beta-xylanase XylA-like [Diorhabda sublineata]